MTVSASRRSTVRIRGDFGRRRRSESGGGPVGAAGRRVHRLAVSHAFHSVLMEPMLDQFARALTGIDAEPRIGLVSNMTGQLAGPGYGSAQYWAEHVRQPVRFVDGVRRPRRWGPGVCRGGAGWRVDGGGGAVAHGQTADAALAVGGQRPR